MRGIGFAEMNAFAEVASRRSFAKAAAQLGVSRSTLSETIRGLEERLGVRLLNRTTRSVAPTEAGERLLLRLRPVLADFEAALDGINTFRNTPAGHLRLTVPPPAARLVIEPILTRFLAEHPAISVEISVDSALTNIVADRFDAGIRPGQRIDRDMIAVRISDEMRFVVVASPDYLTGRPPPATPQELQTHNCIRIRFPSGAMPAWEFEKGGRSFEVSVDGSLIVNTDDLQCRAALEGIGVVYTFEDHVAPLIAEGRLVSLLEDWMPRFPGFYLYYPTRRHVPAALQAFIAFIRKKRHTVTSSKSRTAQ